MILVPLDLVAGEQRLDDVAVLHGGSAHLPKDFNRTNALVRLDIPLDPHEHLVADADHLQSSQVDRPSTSGISGE